jgi:hypothetical protein
LYGDFVWAHRALNRQKRRFPARAVANLAHSQRGTLTEYMDSFMVDEAQLARGLKGAAARMAVRGPARSRLSVRTVPTVIPKTASSLEMTPINRSA